MRCGVSPGLMSSRLNIGETLQTMTPGPHLLWYSSQNTDVSIWYPASPVCPVKARAGPASWSRQKGDTEWVFTLEIQSGAPSPHHSLPQHPLITSTQWTPHTPRTARVRPVLDSPLKPNFSLPRSSISSALHICDGVSCHQPRCLQRTFFSSHYCTGLSKTESPQKGESFIVPDRLSLSLSLTVTMILNQSMQKQKSEIQLKN